MRVERHPDAETELEEDAMFYDNRLPGLGREFVLEVRKTLQRVAQFPYVGSTISKNVRKQVVGRFPFNVLYAIDDELIFAIAIMHQRRKPGYWKNRIARL